MTVSDSIPDSEPAIQATASTREQAASLATSSVERILACYAKFRVALAPHSGIGAALQELKQFANDGTPGPFELDPSSLRMMRWSIAAKDLADTLDRCACAGLDLTDHLKNLRVGDFELGAAARSQHRIGLKNYWYELHLLSQLLRGNVRAKLGPPGDPLADLVVADGLAIQAKNPSSPKKLPHQVRKFGRMLSERGMHGMFCVALEDLFRTALFPRFSSESELGSWLEEKRLQAGFLLESLLPAGARSGQLMGIVLTFRSIPLVGNSLSFRSGGEGFIFERAGLDHITRTAVLHIAKLIAGRSQMLPSPLACRVGRFGLPQSLIRVGLRGQSFLAGQRLGSYQCPQGDPSRIGACVWECTRSAGDQSLFELVLVAGVASKPEQLKGIHTEMMRAITEKNGSADTIILPDAQEWLDSRGIRFPDDLGE